MTLSKAGQTIEEKTCENPVAEQYEVGQLLGIRGTPTMVLETGDLVPGYLPAGRLLQAIEEAKQGRSTAKGASKCVSSSHCCL